MSSSLNADESSGLPSLEGINPLVVIVPLLIVVAIAVLVGRQRGGRDAAAAAGQAAGRAGRKGRNNSRRMLLTLAINLLENDMARRGVIMALKVARSRM